MLYLLIAAAVIVVCLAAIPFLSGRDRRLDEVERFHRARSLTTSWAQSGPAQVEVPAQEPVDEPARAEDGEPARRG